MERADWAGPVTCPARFAAIGGSATATRYVNAVGTWQRKAIGFNVVSAPNGRAAVSKRALKRPLGPAAHRFGGPVGLIRRTLAPRALQTCGEWALFWLRAGKHGSKMAARQLQNEAVWASLGEVGMGLRRTGGAKPHLYPRGAAAHRNSAGKWNLGLSSL